MSENSKNRFYQPVKLVESNKSSSAAALKPKLHTLNVSDSRKNKLKTHNVKYSSEAQLDLGSPYSKRKNAMLDTGQIQAINLDRKINAQNAAEAQANTSTSNKIIHQVKIKRNPSKKDHHNNPNKPYKYLTQVNQRDSSENLDYDLIDYKRDRTMRRDASPEIYNNCEQLYRYVKVELFDGEFKIFKLSSEIRTVEDALFLIAKNESLGGRVRGN